MPELPFVISGGIAGGVRYYFPGASVDLLLALTVALLAAWISRALHERGQ